MTGPDNSLEIIQGTAQEIGISIVEIKAEAEIGPGLFQGIETGKVDQEQNPGLDLAPV